MPSLVRGCTQLLLWRYDEIVLHILGKWHNLDLIPLPYDSQILKYIFINLLNPPCWLGKLIHKENEILEIVVCSCYGFAKYFPLHNSQTIANFYKLLLSRVNSGALNKTHVLFFHNSLWSIHKVQISCSDPAATAKIKIVPLQKTISSKT